MRIKSFSYKKNTLLYCLVIIFLCSCASDKDPEPKQIPKIANPEKIIIKWQRDYLVANPSSQFIPVIDNNVLYTVDQVGSIFKIDASDGTLIKEYQLKSKLSSGSAVSNNSIFVTTKNGYLLSVNKLDGNPEWRAQLPTISIEAPQVSGNIVLVRTNDGQLLAYNATNGSLLWDYQKPIPSLTLRANNTFQVIGQDVVVLGQPGGRLVLLNLTNGNIIWENIIAVPEGATDLDKLTDIASRPVIDGKEICVATYRGKVACLDAISSNIIWSKKFSTSYGLLMDEQNVYAFNQEGVLYAFDRLSGGQVWSNDILRYRSISVPVFLGNSILTVDNDGMIYLFNRNDGKLVGYKRSNLEDGTSYPVLDNQRVFLQSANGDIAVISQ